MERARRTLVFLGAIGLTVSSGGAQTGSTVLGWRDTVKLEHDDRRARLRRLSDASLQASPLFYETLISRAKLPAELGVDIPVLRVVFPQRVFFDTGRHELRPEGARVIALVAEALRREASDTAVFVAGHTDRRGGDAYNYDLSVRRAESVAVALKSAGARQADVWRIGFGKAVPLVPGDTDAEMAQNRRVEFLFARRPEAVGVWMAEQRALVCAGADARRREDCLRDFAALPAVEAVPVLAPKPSGATAAVPTPAPDAASLPRIDTSRLQPVTPPRDRVAVARPESGVARPVDPARGTAAPPPPEPSGTATITREDRVIVDLKEEKVYVGRPKL